RHTLTEELHLARELDRVCRVLGRKDAIGLTPPVERVGRAVGVDSRSHGSTHWLSKISRFPARRRYVVTLLADGQSHGPDDANASSVSVTRLGAPRSRFLAAALMRPVRPAMVAMT